MEKSKSSKLARIRQLMTKYSYDMYIITFNDPHNSEELSERDKVVTYISNFTGSNALIVVTQTLALLWTDGRYHDQAEKELGKEWTLMREGNPGVPSPAEWLGSNCQKGQVVATDPYLMIYSTWTQFQVKLNAIEVKFVAAKENLAYAVWDNRPPASRKAIVPHSIRFSGMPAKDKVEKCREEMKKVGTSVLVLTALDEVAYLLNLRGSDIPHNPVFYSYVILGLDSLYFFVDKDRLTAEALDQLKNEGTKFTQHPYEDVLTVLKKILSMGHEHIWISNVSSAAFHLECAKLKVNTGATPVCLMKVVKNKVEIEGMELAHKKDAVALVKYFAWLEDMVTKGEYVTEISGAAKLVEFRSQQENFMGNSFSTISSFGENGAIIHYRPMPKTDKQITDKELYLCDSGGQYYEGTTDVTRTLHFGTPTAHEKECFTRVFKGQAKVCTAIFPPLIIGNYLDTLARLSLWEVGLNYPHGTGHGIGSYLNVHEYPVMISWRPYPEDPGMQEGVFISNEPGYYESGKFGIRLENIERVVKANTKHSYKNQQFLTFKTVTLVPIQRKMLDINLLTDDEIDYLNAYHRACLAALATELQKPEDRQAMEWLVKETETIYRNLPE